jgi:hypothetical protein
MGEETCASGAVTPAGRELQPACPRLTHLTTNLASSNHERRRRTVEISRLAISASGGAPAPMYIYANLRSPRWCGMHTPGAATRLHGTYVLGIACLASAFPPTGYVAG